MRGGVQRDELHERMTPPVGANRIEPLTLQEFAIAIDRDLWLALVGDVERRTVEHYAGYARSEWPGGNPHRDPRALRHAEQGHARQIQATQQRLEVAHVGGERGMSGRGSEAAPVVANQPQTRRPGCDLRLPHLEVERPAVHQDEGPALPFVTDVQARSVDLDEGVRRLRGAQVAHERVCSHSEMIFA